MRFSGVPSGETVSLVWSLRRVISRLFSICNVRGSGARTRSRPGPAVLRPGRLGGTLAGNADRWMDSRRARVSVTRGSARPRARLGLARLAASLKRAPYALIHTHAASMLETVVLESLRPATPLISRLAGGMLPSNPVQPAPPIFSETCNVLQAEAMQQKVALQNPLRLLVLLALL